MKLELTDKELSHIQHVLNWTYYNGDTFFDKENSPPVLDNEEHNELNVRLSHIITARHVLATENG